MLRPIVHQNRHQHLCTCGDRGNERFSIHSVLLQSWFSENTANFDKSRLSNYYFFDSTCFTPSGRVLISIFLQKEAFPKKLSFFSCAGILTGQSARKVVIHNRLRFSNSQFTTTTKMNSSIRGLVDNSLLEKDISTEFSETFIIAFKSW